jgi:hypothetical protein
VASYLPDWRSGSVRPTDAGERLDRPVARTRHRTEQPIGSDDGLPVAGGLFGPDQSAAIDDQDLLWRALSQLPPGQRAVLVLRYYEDLKAQASRALAKLRGIVGITDYGSKPPDEPKLTDQMSPRGASNG